MKILHVEDDARDAELLQLVFQNEWPTCEIRVVASRDDFLSGLEAKPDLILSDFNMATFNGLEALQLAKERNPRIPFIFLSGTIGEDRAIEALQNGAADYVLKDRPKRLIPAINRALREARLSREREAADEQMRRVQRLENLGMLAAGIAHDFNNVLAPVLMGVPLLRQRLPANGSEQKILNNIENCVSRGANLVRQILGFAHGVTGEPQLIQSKHILRELLAVIEQTFPKSIRLEDEIAPDLWPLKANPTQLHQVLLNLCVNARDAMAEGGTLTLRASNRVCDEVNTPGLKPGPYVMIEVSDTGTGIPPEVLGRMWEPFFTTKEAGRGTGLGLSTVRAIVDEHKGMVTVRTQPGHGCVFQVLLPATPGVDTGIDGVHSGSAPRGHGELVLVVDDDPNVRDVVSAMLTAYGYRVLAAADGAEALALLAPRNLEVRAVITDIDMPHLDGIALAKVVRALSPSIRILTISGSAAASEAQKLTDEHNRFLAKPFTADALLQALHALTADVPAAKLDN